MSEIISRKDARLAGMKRFFSGETCPNGHVSERLVSNGTCIVCSKERLRKWELKKVKHPGGHPRAIARSLGESSFFTGEPCVKGHISARRTSDGKCRECVKQKNKNRQMQDRAYFNACIARWKKKNPEKLRSYEATRRAGEANGTITSERIKHLFNEQMGVCASPWCSALLSERYHVDHVIPLSHGGENSDDNIQLLCPTCNLSKGSKLPLHWALTEGFEVA